MTETKYRILEAEEKANYLFKSIEHRRLITEGKTEHQLNTDIFNLAFELFGIKKYWHKRIVRAGKNTLFPYKENPPNLILQSDDIVFFDFGPVFENWEADIGKTYVLGNNSKKLQLKKDTETAWAEGKEFYYKNKLNLSGADFYE